MAQGDLVVGGFGAEGGDGADTFYAVDKTRDTVSGGAGFDSAQLDAIDARTSIERRF